MKLRSALNGLLALTLVLSCNSGGGGVAGVLVVSSVDVQPGIADVILGQTRQLAATPKTSSGITVPGRSVSWSSTDPLIASVSGSGLVTGVALGGPVRIRATVDGVVGDALLTVRAVPVDRVTVAPASTPLLVNGSVQLTATAFDAGGTPLPGRNFLWESSAPAIAAVTTTGIVIGLAQGGPVTISAISEGKTGTATVSVSTRPATRLAFAQQPGPSVAGLPMSPAIQVALQDDFLTTVLGASNPVTIALAGNPGGAVLGGTTTVDGNNGIATFGNLTLNRTGSGYTFLITSPGLASATSNAFSVVAGAAAQLSFTTGPPASAQSGVAFVPQPVLQLRDAVGNPVAQGGVVVTATIASGAGTVGGSTTATTNGAGVATFGTLSLSGAAGSYTLSFGAPGITPLVSGTVTLGSGAAVTLAMVTQPSSSAQSGIPLAQQPSVQLKDGSGNNVSQAGVVITASIATGGGSLGGVTTASTNAAGLAQFSSLAINGPSGTYTLGFNSPGLSGAASSAVVLGAGLQTQLAIITQPSSTASSGVAFPQQPVVQLRDASNNPVATAGVSVTASITGGGGTLLGTTTVTTNASGNAVFTNLAISGLAGTRTLTFTSGALLAAVSGDIVLSAGAATQLGLTTQPSPGGASGVAFATQPVVQIQDAAGNPVSQGGIVVTAVIVSGPAGATLGGTTSVTTSGTGAATFTNLAITGPSGTYTLQFSTVTPGLTAVTSAGITLGAGAATQLVISTQPSSTAQSGAVLSQQPVIQLRDASNNPAAQAGIVVTATIASGGGSLGGTTTATTNASGIATFTNLSITGVIGARTLGFTSPGLTGAVSGTITLSAGAATQLSITTPPSSSAQSGVAFLQQPSIQLRDAAGNAVSQGGVIVTAAIASGGGTLGGTTTASTNGSGLATFSNLSISGIIGNRTLVFSAPALTSVTSGTITLTAGVASQVTITTQPSSSAQSGVQLAQQPVLQLRDASGNAVSQAGVNVTASIASGGGLLGGTTTIATNGSGVAAFTNLSITGLSGDRTLAFGSAGLTGATSGVISVTAGAASKLSITTQPSGTAQSGVAFAQQPVIQLQDAIGNNVSTSGVVVTAAISSGGGALGGTVTAMTVSGVATFTNLAITGVIGPRTLVFTASGFTSVTSSPITITAGAATQLGVTIQPSSSAQSGVAFGQQPALQLLDASGNAVSQAGVVVTAVIATGGGTLGGTATATTNAGGTATFSNLSISGTIGNRTLGFSAPSLSGTSSGTITITPGPASQLLITTQPSATAQSGVAFAQQPVIQLLDASGNAVAQAGIGVTAAIASGPGGSLGGATTVTTSASGAATFANLSLSGATGNYTLQFTSGALTPATSNPIGLSAGTGTALSVTTQPSASVQNGAVFPQQPVIQVTDGVGNPVAQPGVVVSVTIQTGAGTLGGTTTATTNASGVATFTDLSITGSTGARTLLFGAAGFVGVASAPITVTAGTPTQLTYNTQPPVTATNGAAFTPQPALLLRDASNNPVNGATVTATITGSPAGVSLIGSVTATTNASGIATFSGLGLTGPAGNYTLTFTANGGALSSPASNSIALSAGVAAVIAANSVTSQSGPVSTAVSAPPSVKVTDTGTNPVQGVAVTFAVTAGSGTLGAPTTVNTDVNGIATISSWTLGSSAGTNNNTVTATATGLSGSSVTFTASGTVGAPTQMNYFTQPSTTATNGVAFNTQPVIRVQDAGGNNVAAALVTATITGAPAGVSLIGTVNQTTASNGRATFSGLGLVGPAGTYSLTFTTNAGALSSAASNDIVLSAGAAAIISANSVTSQSAAVNTAVAAPPSVKVTDTGTNPISGVAVTYAVTGGGGTLGAPLTFNTNASGIATIASWTLGPSAGTNNNTVQASSGSLTGSPVTFTASGTTGSATQLTYNSQPSTTAQSGAPFAQQPALLLRDAGSNPVASATVTATITGAPAGVSLVGSATATTDGSGVATFSGLGLSGPAGTYTLTFTANGGALSSAASNSIALSAGAAAIITANSVTSQSATVSTAVAAPPSVLVTDAASNPVQGVAVTFDVTAGGGTVVPAGPATVTTGVNGIATATSWTLGSSAGTNNNTVTATATGLAGSPVSFTASGTSGSATQLTYNTQPPANATNDVAFVPQPVILVRDAGNNPVGGVLVTATITGAPVGVSLIGTTTATSDGSGLAAFSGLGLRGPIGNYTLTFSANAGGLSSAASDPVALAAGAAAIITANSATSQSSTVNTTVAAPPSVKVTDTGTNPIAGVAVTFDVTATAGGGSVVPAGPATVTTDVNGIATATSWTVGTTAGTDNNAVTATAAGLTGSPVVFTASGTAGTATQLTISIEPSAAANDNIPFPQQPVLLLRDAFNNPVTNASVTATITGAPPGVSLIGTVTVSTNGSGLATFAGLGLTGTPGNYTLTFTANGGALSSPTSVSITLTP